MLRVVAVLRYAQHDETRGRNRTDVVCLDGCVGEELDDMSLVLLTRRPQSFAEAVVKVVSLIWTALACLGLIEVAVMRSASLFMLLFIIIGVPMAVIYVRTVRAQNRAYTGPIPASNYMTEAARDYQTQVKYSLAIVIVLVVIFLAAEAMVMHQSGGG